MSRHDPPSWFAERANRPAMSSSSSIEARTTAKAPSAWSRGADAASTSPMGVASRRPSSASTSLPRYTDTGMSRTNAAWRNARHASASTAIRAAGYGLGIGATVLRVAPWCKCVGTSCSARNLGGVAACSNLTRRACGGAGPADELSHMKGARGAGEWGDLGAKAKASEASEFERTYPAGVSSPGPAVAGLCGVGGSDAQADGGAATERGACGAAHGSSAGAGDAGRSGGDAYERRAG
jgi:hypothetical protein